MSATSNAQMPGRSSGRDLTATPVIASRRSASLASEDWSRTAFRSVLDSMVNGVCILDEQRRIRCLNVAAARLLRWDREDLVGAGIEEIAAGTTALAPGAAWLLKLVLERIQHGRNFRVSGASLTAGDRSEVSVDVLVTPLRRHHRVVGTVVELVDATERELAQQALREGEERFRAIFNAAGIGMMRLDPAGRIGEMNQALREVLDTSEPDLQWVSLHDLIEESHRELSQKMFSALLAGERSRYSIELPLRSGDGTVWCQVTMSVLRDRTGWPLFAIGAVQDLTQRRRLEDQLTQSTKLEAIGRMASGIAHEINTPVQFIGDNVRFLADSFDDVLPLARAVAADHNRDEKPDPADLERLIRDADLDFVSDEVPTAVEQTLEGVQRVATIVKAMKALGHGSRAGQQTSADLNKAIRDTLTVARNEIKYVADVELALGELPPVTCDIGEISQTLLNLFVNAAHAIADVVGDSERRGTITVSSALEGDHVVVRINDTGGGIPDDIRSAVYDPFFTTKQVGRGSGQGLALARVTVCDKHGGDLSFETSNQGTTFTVRLPVEGKGPEVEL